MTTHTPTVTQPNSRKDVRNAITATARKFASLREQWVIRTDLADYSGPFVKHTRSANYPCVPYDLNGRNL